jgi:3-dehydroquinate dehydratase-2
MSPDPVEDGTRAAPVIVLLHGPNLNLLGQREPHIYGTATLADHVANAREAATRLGFVLEDLQSNHEGALVDAIHAAAYPGVVVELHLSNPNAREPWRHTSVVAPVATGSITGFGAAGYPLAVEAVARALCETRGLPEASA